MAVQRESQVARKISVIVISNMTFFVMPFLILMLVDNTPLHDVMSFRTRETFWKTFMYYSFATNACLNPMLFAFRNDKFRVALRKQLHLAPANVVDVSPGRQ